MNLSKNLIVALLGLGCYARSNSINLANNTTILLIILALMAKHNNDDSNIEIANNTRTTVNTCPCASSNYSAPLPAQVVYAQPYPVNYTSGCYNTPRNNCYYTVPVVPYQTTVPYCTPCGTSSWHTPRCHSHYTSPCHNVLY